MVLFLILLLLSITVALILTRRAVTVLRTASTGTVPTATLAEARSPESWDGARPLATAIDGLDDATAVWQLSKLREARQLAARMRDAKAQSSDVLEFAFVSPDEKSSLTFSLAFMPDGDVIISERARGFPLGFLPYFSLIREVDLLPSLLPPVIARPLEELSIRHRFANNDLMYHVCARGFGPIPGADDFFFVLLFDVTDAPHDGAVLAFVETPPAGANVYRDLELPPCTKRGYTRTTGLVLGSGLFVVIYSSTTVWTALWASWNGERLSAGRWLGVLLIFLGMLLNTGGSFAQVKGDATATSTMIVGVIACLCGTILHAAMFVYSEVAIKRVGIEPLVLSASMGIVETSCLAAWNLGLLATEGPELYVDPRHTGDVDGTYILTLYGGLILVNAAHAWSFFNMLDQVGAVSSAVMKGAQVVLVFASSVVFFCQFQASQCFSWSKAIAVAVVVAGLLIYAYSTSQDKASPPKPPAATKLPKPELV